jgi:hypothetical protein
VARFAAQRKTALPPSLAVLSLDAAGTDQSAAWDRASGSGVRQPKDRARRPLALLPANWITKCVCRTSEALAPATSIGSSAANRGMPAGHEEGLRLRMCRIRGCS